MSDPLNLDKLPKRPKPADEEGLAPTTFEDASAQALSEALRSSFRIIRLIMIGLVLLFLCSGVFVVQPNEQVILLRLGKPVGVGEGMLFQPGWHWAWPYPIDEKVRIRTGQSQTVTSSTGWYAVTPEMDATNAMPTAYGFLRPESEGYTLTGDGGIVHVKATLKYRVSKPLRYHLDFADVPALLTNVLNEAIFHASARFTADAAVYKDRPGFRDAVMERVNELVEKLDLGIVIETGDVEVLPPADLFDAYVKVNNAEEQRGTELSKARSYRDETVRTAIGQAKAIINSGLVSSNWLISQVVADERAFLDQLPLYRENRDLYKQRLLAAAMERVLTNASVKFTLPEQFDELRLQVTREPEKLESKTAR
jgi:membrane protease subunit HflK